jgi:hypothetical protein
MKSNNNNNDDDDDDNNNNNTAMGSVHARGDTFLTFGLKALTETNTSRLATGGKTDVASSMQSIPYYPVPRRSFLGRVKARAVCRRPLTAEVRVRVQVSPCGICGVKSITEIGFSSSSSVFPANIIPPGLQISSEG